MFSRLLNKLARQLDKTAKRLAGRYVVHAKCVDTGLVKVIYSWTREDALEWMECYGAEDSVLVLDRWLFGDFGRGPEIDGYKEIPEYCFC